MAPWLAVVVDTMIVRQVPVEPTTFQQVTAVASGIASIVLCLIVLSIIPAALYLRAQVQKAVAAISKARIEAEPALQEASTLLADMRAIASTARTDVATVHQVVVDTDASLRAIRTRFETRVAEIDHLIEVVQHEAEDMFVSTAAAARGLRAGARVLADRQNGAAPSEAPDLPVRVPDNGHDYTREARAGDARPRIRSRREP